MFDGLTKYKFNKIKETLLNGKFEIIPLVRQPSSLIALPNNNFVFGTNFSAMLFNENLEQIKTISTGGYSFCALNHRNQICVSVGDKDFIILFDLNLQQLKQFGSRGSGNNQLDYPIGLCCHEDYLYICDYFNQRIQIFTHDLEYSNTIQLDDRPFRIQISETTIGISCFQATLFYDLKTKTLRKKYNFVVNMINYIDSIFYTSNLQDKKFYFFDSEGNLIEQMLISENLRKYMTNWPSGTLYRYKDILYLTDFNSSKLLKFIK